jgi:hypothetical protein
MAEAEMVAEDAAQHDAPGETPEAQGDAIRIGRVVAVSGSQVITLLENVPHDDDDPDAPKLQIGTLIKTETPASTVFGMVSGLSIPIPKQDAGDTELNIIEMELVGETMKDSGKAEQPFQRGVSVFPTLGDSVYVASKVELGRVYAPTAVDTVRIGTIHQDEALPAYVGPTTYWASTSPSWARPDPASPAPWP